MSGIYPGDALIVAILERDEAIAERDRAREDADKWERRAKDRKGPTTPPPDLYIGRGKFNAVVAERDSLQREVERLRALLTESNEYIEHASWRCAHPPHYYFADGPFPDMDGCPCGLESFERRARAALDPESVPPVPYSPRPRTKGAVMDARGNIYRAPEDLIPAEDKARLDGFLIAREEMAVLKDVQSAEFEARIAELEAERERLLGESRTHPKEKRP